MLGGRKRDDHPFFPAAKSRANEMTALIRSMQAATTCLNGRKPVGKIPICKLRLWHFPLPEPRISTLRRYRRLQYAAFGRPWTKITLHNLPTLHNLSQFSRLSHRIFSGAGSRTALMRLVHFYFPSASIGNPFHDAFVAP